MFWYSVFYLIMKIRAKGVKPYRGPDVILQVEYNTIQILTKTESMDLINTSNNE